MKDIVITVKRQKTELRIWLVCLAVAFGLNVYAIIAYEGQWAELYHSIGFVVTASFVIYVILLVIRLCFYGIWRTIGKSQKTK